eukprot:104772_1
MWIFYSEIETVGTHTFPKEAPVIVAMNHTNSLGDAGIAYFISPRDIRQTCKDTLLTQGGISSFMIQHAEPIPFKRRSDYDASLRMPIIRSNTVVVHSILKELAKGCVVSIFPEGLCRYKPQLSRFRYGVARTAIDYVVSVLKGDIISEYDYIYIVPVGITYLHRAKFRSVVSVRINSPLKIDKAFLDQYTIENVQNIDRDTKYEITEDITSRLYQTILHSTISSTDWHTICLSHLSRQIAFPESSSPRMGTFCAQYVDLTRQFNKIFIENKNINKYVDGTLDALDKYWRLLYAHGLKDNRIFQMQHNLSKLSIACRLMYRWSVVLVLCVVAAPGIVLALPLIATFRFIHYKKVNAGFYRNYDEIAHTKGLATVIIILILAVCYAVIISKKISKLYGLIFGLLFPFLMWMTMRLCEEGVSSMRSFWNLLKMLCLSREARQILIGNRKICQRKIKAMVKQFNVGYNSKLVNESDVSKSQSISPSKSWFRYILRRICYRVKNDWNETLRLYDVPVDEFHLHDHNEEQLQMSYKI